MIPKKIQIKNFLSYGSEPIIVDFLSYNLICLSGKNGHGKSALLDAMTWALWGQARKTNGTSKADEGLVHLGQKHMLVVFDFEINGENYRVRREFVKTKSTPFSALDFGIVKADDSFTTLTDKTIKATQKKLEKTIGVSYESFINSAFLRQGQANEFSKKSPKERKEILATILQLERFEDLKKIAVEKNKNLQLNLIQKQSLASRIKDETTSLQEALSEINSHLQQLQSIEQQEKSCIKTLSDDENQQNKLLEQQKKYEFIQLQITEYKKQQHDLEQQKNECEKKYQSIAAEQSNILNIKTVEEEQQKIREIIKVHQEKLNKRLELKDQYLNLQEEKQKIEFELAQEKNEHLQKYEIVNKSLQDQIKHQQEFLKIHEKKDLEITHEMNQLETMLITHEIKIKELEPTIPILIIHEKLFEENKNKFQSLKTQGLLIDKQLIDLAQKNKLSLDNQDPSCPLCEQNLSISRKKFLEQKFNKEELSAKTDLSNIKKEALQLQQQLTQDQVILQSYKKFQEELTQLIPQADEFTKQITKLNQQKTEALIQIKTFFSNIIALEKKLNNHQTEQKKSISISINSTKETTHETLIKKIEVLKLTAQKLGYDKNAHETDYKQLQLIEIKLASYQNLKNEATQQEQRLQKIITLQQQQEKINQSVQLCSKEFEQVQNIPTLLTEHLQLMAEHKELLRSICVQKNDLMNKKAIFELQSKKLLSLQQECVNVEKEADSINLEIMDFAEIVKALGKDGLQALLIEEALPEIEQEANILLAPLTDNQTQIYIESLRDLKKGGSKETLDIKISDAIGLRPYEMFSGGEAFRIDFALRIAISKLLARRAGTSLQTLIIDEGFGSQDDDGLQLIMDSILKIQSNFAMVIIVSHLPSMKDQFPVQFLVEKKASGSVITVVEQG